VDLGGTPEKIPLDLIPDNQIVGGDLGLNILLYLSNDEKIERVRFTKNSEKKLAKQQRKLSRKKKGSNGYKRQRALVAKTNDRIANQRLDYLRKVAVYLVLHYKLIFLEDLNVKGMVQGLNYGKSIYDAAWSLLVSLVQFKAESAGSWVVKVDPRDTSQDCSGCGKLVPKDLTVRIHSCPYCGLILDRDLNAAMNIRSRGLRELGLSVSTTDEPRSACID
jgi:putative transposase